MRLINTTTLQQREFYDSRLTETPYAILSHCWGDDEISFEAFMAGHFSGPGWQKIENCCALAREQGIEWAWVDTCCIDKRSSAELSEAINSMFKWYQQAKVCYAFLHDFDASAIGSAKAEESSSICVSELPFEERGHFLGQEDSQECDLGDAIELLPNISLQPNILMPALGECKWWTRGWTLQELIAPSEVLFYDANLQYIGNKESLADVIAEISKIDKKYLCSAKDIPNASVATRMSWASMRVTTRAEDLAYCLLGIFDVNMPLLYGEGEKAFFRLQQAIIGQSRDQSLFAWTSKSNERPRGVLAQSPSEFANSRDIHPVGSRNPYYHVQRPYQLVNTTLEFYAPISWRKVLFAFLTSASYWRNIVVLKCVRQGPNDAKPLPVVIHLVASEEGTLYRYRTMTLDPPCSAMRLGMTRMVSIQNYKHQLAVKGGPRAVEGPEHSMIRRALPAFLWFPNIFFPLTYWLILSRTHNYTAISNAQHWVILTCGWQFLHFLSNGGTLFLTVSLIFGFVYAFKDQGM